MSGTTVYNENLKVSVLRDQVPYLVCFREIKAGDQVCDMSCHPWFVASGDAHMDSEREGWIVHGTDGGCYYPEDLGAKMLYEQMNED